MYIGMLSVDQHFAVSLIANFCKTGKHRCVHSFEGTRARHDYAIFDAQLRKVYTLSHYTDYTLFVRLCTHMHDHLSSRPVFVI